MTSHAVRLPAYVFDYSHGTTVTVSRDFKDERHTAVVCGTSGNVGGDELISENKARESASHLRIRTEGGSSEAFRSGINTARVLSPWPLSQARVAGGAAAAASGILLHTLSSGALNLGAAGLEWVFLAGIAGTLAVSLSPCGPPQAARTHVRRSFVRPLTLALSPAGCIRAVAPKVEEGGC